MSQIIFNDQINAGLTALFLAVVVIVAVYGFHTAMKARKVGWPTAQEIPPVFRNETAGASSEAVNEA